MAATRTNDIYLASPSTTAYAPACGHGKALGAVKHSIICACWHMLTTGELYREAGGDYFTHRDPERATRRLVAQLERSATPSPSRSALRKQKPAERSRSASSSST